MPVGREVMEMKTVDSAAPNRLMVAAAFAAIYVIWGSTYLAIKYAIETVPPFFMTAVRFAIAGGVLYLWSVFRASRAPATNVAEPPTALVWRDAFIVGALLIVGGTALVGWAELAVPSGITSLILASNPLWMALCEGIVARRAPSGRVMAGLFVGLAGLAILVGPAVVAPGQTANLLGIGALLVASLTWTIGALYSRKATLPTSPARATGLQMIAGGVLSLVVGFAVGEHRGLSLSAITPSSLLAIGYLVIFGALIGFSAYLWLMRVSTPSRVATHAYVNPVVAVLLGWAMLGEAVTTRTVIAMVVIVVAVVLIVSAPARGAATDAAADSVPPRGARRSLRERAA
jgi:drug/metabolite transporter (DMT)-like permease